MKKFTRIAIACLFLVMATVSVTEAALYRGGAGGSATSIVLDGVLVAVLGGGGGGGGGGIEGNSSGDGEDGSGYGDNEGVVGVTRALDLDAGTNGQSANPGQGGGDDVNPSR